MRSVDLPEVSDLEGADAAKLEVLLAAADRVRCQAEAIVAEIAQTAETTRAHRADGHKSTVAWLRANRSWSTSRAITCSQVGRMLTDLASVRDAFHAGTIGIDQILELAKVHANPRCGDRLADVETVMLRHARHLPHVDFRARLHTWERLADEDGAYQDLDRINEGRAVRTGSLNAAFRLEADGPALAGTHIVEILDRFTRTEFQTDWDALVAQVGPHTATVSMLARTNQQRRFDALHNIFLQAASTAPGSNRPDTLTDVVIDHATFERTAARLCGLDTTPDDPARFDHAHCHTLDGVTIDPRHAALAALLGHVRRVLWTAPGIPTEIGTKRRLFTGTVRTAIELLATHCVHPGCHTPTRTCQADHLHPASEGGPTTVHNGAPKCGPQNRFTYHTGYHTWRDPHGYWHTTRPDHTELGPTDWWDTS